MGYKYAPGVDFCFGLIANFLQLGDLETMRILKPGGHLLLSGKYVSLQAENNSCSVCREESPVYFMIATGSESPILFVSDSSHNFSFIWMRK